LTPILLSLQFVPSHLLLLFGLSNTEFGKILIDGFIITVGCRAGCGGWSGGSGGGTVLGNTSSGSTGFGGCSGSSTRWVVECVFDNGDFTTVGEFTIVDMPDFGAKGGNEFLRMRNDADRTSPFLDCDSETTIWLGFFLAISCREKTYPRASLSKKFVGSSRNRH
jgi:hypothetical protein